MKLGDLVPDERLIIERRRLGETQARAAKRYATTLYTYRRWEEGGSDCPNPGIGRLEVHEACFIERRREKLPATVVAAGVGVSRWWITLMERGSEDPARLVAWWDARNGRSSARRGRPARKA